MLRVVLAGMAGCHLGEAPAAGTSSWYLPLTALSPTCIYPCHSLSLSAQELRDLVKRLLVRSTGRRLGCTSGGATEVKQHPWFK